MAEARFGKRSRAGRLRRPAEARVIVEEAGATQWLIQVRDRPASLGVEGYYHNVSDAGAARVRDVAHAAGARGAASSVSYDEASRWMMAREWIRGDAAGLFAWVGEFVEKNYRSEPKKRIKPQSFLSPKDRRAADERRKADFLRRCRAPAACATSRTRALLRRHVVVIALDSERCRTISNPG